MAEMASANMECSATSESLAAHVSNVRPVPAGQLLPKVIVGKEDCSVNGAKMETEDSTEQSSVETDEEVEQAYKELLAKKESLEAELQEIIDGLQPLKIQLEELDKSIAKDEEELPILEAMMMEEVRMFLALSPKCTRVRPGA